MIGLAKVLSVLLIIASSVMGILLLSVTNAWFILVMPAGWTAGAVGYVVADVADKYMRKQ